MSFTEETLKRFYADKLQCPICDGWIIKKGVTPVMSGNVLIVHLLSYQVLIVKIYQNYKN